MMRNILVLLIYVLNILFYVLYVRNMIPGLVDEIVVAVLALWCIRDEAERWMKKEKGQGRRSFG